MTLTARHALITGGSRGIGRGIAFKLADHGVHVAINYLRDEASAKATLEQVRARGGDGFTVQADVGQPAEIERLFARVRAEFGSLDIFIANARTEVGTFYEPPFAISLDKWDTAMNSQAKAFLVGVREAQALMPDGGRIIAITYAPGGRYRTPQGFSVNIGVETPEISMLELAEKLAVLARELFGYKGKVVRQESEDKDYLTDNPNRRCPILAKARTELGFDPQISLDDGLRRSLLWYAANREAAEG